MLELTTIFTPKDGSPQRTITLRIRDVLPAPDGQSWTVGVDVLGFKNDESVTLEQVDWSNAIQDAARFISKRVTAKVELAGGGALDPPVDPLE
jgi:hypothetical protein